HGLEELGVTVTALSARSRYQWPERYSLPRTHMCLRVDLNQRTFLVDGGFGGLSPSAALEIVADMEQQTPHEPRRFVREGHWKGLALRGQTRRSSIRRTWATLGTTCTSLRSSP